MLRGTRASARLGLTSLSPHTDMARDTKDTAETSVVRRKKGAKEAKVANGQVNTRKGMEAEDEKKMTADIQEELTQKLENLLERDRLGVRGF